MDIFAESKSNRISERKVRLIADEVRKLSLEKAIVALSLAGQRGAVPLLKTLKSAVANAVNNNKLDRKNLGIKTIDVSEGPFLKRFHAGTRGRTQPYKKRSCHIRITLTERKNK